MSGDMIVSDHPSGRAGQVGYFWLLVDREGHDAIFADTLDLASAETYGELLTHPGGHYVFWEKMKRRGSAWLRARNLPAALLSSEYEDWPRGRVVYSPSQECFFVYADARIQTPSRIALVTERFQISGSNVVISGDSHYRPPPASIVEDSET
ncbi:MULTISPECIES: hypothetical protein [unclassified Mesorhizobium]|uniref:hypothetical protein n=1 Tax=unclassified Mesorhizobium TaxID=325217 RepID=UPI000FE83097|nr:MULTISPECIES: hypothetical protein [unclassified Mesorhizobium]RWB73239.1 MAG: hypothetical protein EOQ49_11015 [Mesorhizobium sp.]RWB90841.1 MAG: hypothetical protein EOQ52_09545 [Mesorhizobium sp.]RWC10806.1 MAG: hypothetical protein EOS52_23850 [Mesorhizobium sp.]TGS64062.1 hypothetical protein EN844_21350 [Mesorhizobium sp. M3A.F.Ca.ET.201.01.1.1]TGS85786.1 hypothetical protein EN818_17600 [Mesorhizobium sp. M3A.F.Ca.ET.175.01.1.1]